MHLYGYFRSSAAYRVRIALNLKGLNYETVATPLLSNAHRTPEYLQRNPQGLIPALEVDGQVLPQSMAIIEFLEERYPDPPLLAQDAYARAQIRGMALSIAC